MGAKVMGRATEREELPVELRSLVHDSVALLGEVIRDEKGDTFFGIVETVRKKMVSLRSTSESEKHTVLKSTLLRFRNLSEIDRFHLAHSFSLMLELINVCENAYRTFRLSRRESKESKHIDNIVIYVVTSHPTEARSPQTIFLFRQIQSVLLLSLRQSFSDARDSLYHLLRLLWQREMARSLKPAVVDEAAHIYSVALRPEIISALIESSQKFEPIYLRSWVGGDKDGHPDVNEKSISKSLELSRKQLLDYLRLKAKEVVDFIDELSTEDLEEISNRLKIIESKIFPLRFVGGDDNRFLTDLLDEIDALHRKYAQNYGTVHPSLSQMRQLFRIFPALVVPLEIRENSDLIRNALEQGDEPINRMLKFIRRISENADPRWYVRGFVVSHTETIDDYFAAISLVRRVFGKLSIPVVPLFEDENALRAASSICDEILSEPEIRRACEHIWDNYFEVMLGYSDSAKTMGSLPSRVAIAKAVWTIDSTVRRYKATPLFFHGSGGSVDRGGGSIAEQTEWWPHFAVYKATLQGEMVERTLASPEIALSGLRRIHERLSANVANRAFRSSEPLEHFSQLVRSAFAQKTNDESFLEIFYSATPYEHLSSLNIGSRPASRSAQKNLASLRAIPWVLSWTQCRTLFPVWWGTGSAWQKMTRSQRVALRREFNQNSLFRSFIKLLSFTLAKIELSVFRLYLERAFTERRYARKVYEEFVTEYKASLELVRYLSRERSLMWFRPWLGTSIEMRSPMIHPLNLLQLLAMEKNNELLFRETVTGIASGMMTTG